MYSYFFYSRQFIIAHVSFTFGIHFDTWLFITVFWGWCLMTNRPRRFPVTDACLSVAVGLPARWWRHALVLSRWGHSSHQSLRAAAVEHETRGLCCTVLYIRTAVRCQRKIVLNIMPVGPLGGRLFFTDHKLDFEEWQASYCCFFIGFSFNPGCVVYVCFKCLNCGRDDGREWSAGEALVAAAALLLCKCSLQSGEKVVVAVCSSAAVYCF